LIDLHLHTVASDGRSTPAELVDLAASAGVSVMAVTDHDTVASSREVAEAARKRDIEAITGIEITAVEAGWDVHMLGYFLDIDDPGLRAFLAGQRQTRITRVERIAGSVERIEEEIASALEREIAAAMLEIDAAAPPKGTQLN